MAYKPILYPRKVKPPRNWREYTMQFCVKGEDYNVAEYYDNFGHTLPKIVMVNQGFCGEIIEDTFDRGQIMRLHTVSKQKRVIAKFVVSGQKRLVSIPISYKDKMCVLDKKEKPGAEKTLAAIVKEHQLPVFIQFPPDRVINVGNQNISTNWIPKMELVQTFDEMYFLSNFIIEGVLVSDVTPVPLYLKQLRLVDVTGIEGQPAEKWRGYVEQIELACTKIYYDTGFGNSEVAVYDPSANYTDTTYSFIEPTVYSSMNSFFKKPVFGNPSYTITEEPEPSVKGDVYDEICSGHNGPNAKPSTAVNKQLTDELNCVIYSKKTDLKYKSIAVPVPPPVAPKPKPLPETVPVPPERKPFDVLTESTKTGYKISNAYSNIATKIIPVSKTPAKKQTVEEQSIPMTTTSINRLKSLESQDEVQNLTINQLGEYLQALNLGMYIEKFKSELVDGSLLIELDKDVLKQDFGLKTVEAIRLEKFAKSGHIPT